MNTECNNCGKPMPQTTFRACEACRAEWRQSKRKPGGHADQRDALAKLVRHAKDMARMLEAVRYTAGLGKSQIDRLDAAKRAISDTESIIATWEAV